MAHQTPGCAANKVREFSFQGRVNDCPGIQKGKRGYSMLPSKPQVVKLHACTQATVWHKYIWAYEGGWGFMSVASAETMT